VVKLFSILKTTLNENMKIYRRVRTWVMLAILVAIVGLIAYFMAREKGAEIPNGNALDFMFFSANFINTVAIFSVIVAGDIVASEFGWGTIKLLLIRPVSRTKILISKYIAVVLFTLFFIISLFLFSFLFGLIFFGTGETKTTISDVLIEYAYELPNLVIAFTIAFMISAIFRSSALAIGVSIFLMTGASELIIVLLSKYDWVKYLLYANTNLTQYKEGNHPIVEGMTMGFSLTVLAIYYLIFIGLTWWFFNKRDVAN
jgi:ABC-2 type transport system permease protein